MINLTKLFSLPIFIISFILGLIFINLSDKPSKIIHVYPTPDNVHKFEYKDKAENCFEYEATVVNCPSDIKKIKVIPIQN